MTLNLATDRPILAYGYLMVLDENKASYTDLSVSQLVYEKLDQGMDASKIAKFLNEKGVPTGREAVWPSAPVGQMLDDKGRIFRLDIDTRAIPGQERPDREGMPQIMQAGTVAIGGTTQANLV